MILGGPPVLSASRSVPQDVCRMTIGALADTVRSVPLLACVFVTFNFSRSVVCISDYKLDRISNSRQPFLQALCHCGLQHKSTVQACRNGRRLSCCVLLRVDTTADSASSKSSAFNCFLLVAYAVKTSLNLSVGFFTFCAFCRLCCLCRFLLISPL